MQMKQLPYAQHSPFQTYEPEHPLYRLFPLAEALPRVAAHHLGEDLLENFCRLRRAGLNLLDKVPPSSVSVRNGHRVGPEQINAVKRIEPNLGCPESMPKKVSCRPRSAGPLP